MGEIIANTLNKGKNDIFTFNRMNKEQKELTEKLVFLALELVR